MDTDFEKWDMEHIEKAAKHTDLTGKIIGAAFDVHKELGSGFLEKLYHNALVIELEKRGLRIETEKPIDIYYKKRLIGNYVCDLLVEGTVIVETKAAKKLLPVHEAQVINYLKATEIELGLLINFGRSVKVKRLVFDKL